MSDLSSNDQMLEIFLFEMNSLLEQLDTILLNSEKNRALTEEDIGEVFRIMHTIKGSSAMMDFNVISTVTHRLEDAFFIIRDNGIDPQHFTQLFDLMLDATDFLKSQLEAIQSGSPLAEGNESLVSRSLAFLDILRGTTTAAAPPPAQQVAAPPTESAYASFYHAEVYFEEDCGMENMRAFQLLNSLKNSCEIIGYEPSDIETNSEASSQILLNGFNINLKTDLDQDALHELMEHAMHVKTVAISPLDSSAEAPAAVGGAQYQIHVMFDTDCGMENLRSFMLVNSLRGKCDILSLDPPDIETNPATADVIMQNGFAFAVATPMPQAQLEQLLTGSMYVRAANVEPLAFKAAAALPADSASAKAAVPAHAAQSESSEKNAQKTAAVTKKPIKQNLINVNLSKLDELMDIMGELVITESMVTRSPDLKNVPSLDNFHKSARQLRKLTDELQDMVMSIRMIPISGTFQKMQRIVRDMCRNLGKDTELVTMGEETDIDKTIIDGIADPIMHLVRNAMDHGIEQPADRVAAGKPAKGIVTLSAQNTGGEILITVSDDGKGLDAEALLAKGKKNGILTKPANEYTEKEAFMLLMAPGFSTKEKVTEYSGRGVGMDVVKKNIEKVGGTVHIESKKGHGMSVFLKIPLTLAIVDGMDISVGGGVYTLQITAINESFKATAEQVIIDTSGNEMIMIRGDVYPIIRLHELYHVENAFTNIEDGILVWVQSGEKYACLFVDQLIGEQQIVVKPLPAYLNRYNVKPWGISGCTILGDGNISLILDVGNIIEKVMEMR